MGVVVVVAVVVVVVVAVALAAVAEKVVHEPSRRLVVVVVVVVVPPPYQPGIMQPQGGISYCVLQSEMTLVTLPYVECNHRWVHALWAHA